MESIKTTIKGFFEGQKQYIIPVYQRAYSWEEPQWQTFLEDLEEAAKGSNYYFFGNILLEKTNNTQSAHIIDGQQRITTIVIFARAVCDVLGKKLENSAEKEILDYIREDYFQSRGKDKLESVSYDKVFFQNEIIEGKKDNDVSSDSKKRIRGAKKFFTKELETKETSQILKIFNTMQDAEVLRTTFEKKKDSVLMFELQNNRGKNLTNMEKLKSYLAYQIYTYASDEREAELELGKMTDIFKNIYETKGNASFKEDEILNYYNMSLFDFGFDFGFNYRENDDTKNYKKGLWSKESRERIEWIQAYVYELNQAFKDYKDYYENSSYKVFFDMLGVSQIYPFIFKAYRLFRDDEPRVKQEKLEKVFETLEILAFRDRVSPRRGKLVSHINDILKDFNNVESLVAGLRDICTDQSAYWGEYDSYWGDIEIEKGLYADDNKFDDVRDMAKYVLVHYENHLRNKNIRKKGYTFSIKDIKEPQIEHISPQRPSDGTKLKTGYDNYNSKYWKNGRYLNCLGNFLLIDKKHNTSIGNKPFKEKLASYDDSPLSHHQEVKRFANGEKWDMDAINKRHKELKNFVFETWSFKD